MNGLVSGYGSDSEEEDPTTRPSCLGSPPRKDNGAVKSTEKGLLLVDISYVTFTKKLSMASMYVTHFPSLDDRFFAYFQPLWVIIYIALSNRFL